MNAIEYVVRTSAGVIQSDVVQPGAMQTLVTAAPGAEISFNLSRTDMRGYMRVDENLHIELADGRVIVLEGYFSPANEEPRLFISSDGLLHEVFFAEGGDGVLFAEYGQSAEWGKWSPDDALIYTGRPEVASVETYAEGENDVSMLAAGLLGGGPLLGALGLAGTAAVGAAVVGGGGGDGGDGGGGDVGDGGTGIGDDGSGGGTGDEGDGGDDGTGAEDDGSGGDGGTQTGDEGDGGNGAGDEGNGNDDGGADTGGSGGGTSGWTAPTVDDTAIVVGGDGAAEIVTVTGTGHPGATVDVTLGGATISTVVDANGDWTADFEGADFPADGDYSVAVSVTFVDTDNSFSETLTGPDVTIDLTGPALDVTGGTAEVGDLINLVAHPDGLTVTGTGEAGATVSVTIDGVTHDTVVDLAGVWSVDYVSTEIATGEYTTDVTVVSSDAYGNTTTLVQTLAVDTIPNAITIDTGIVGGNGVVNASEAAGDLTISGTATVGAVVEVTVAGIVQTVTADANGAWSFVLPAGSFADGTYDATISAASVDAAGNTSSTSGTVQVDTEAMVTINDATIETDGVVNAAEHSDGVAITGTAEAGATVDVTMNGVTLTSTADANGAWTVTYAAADVPTGAQSLPISVVATDAHGNSASATGTVEIDTVVDPLQMTSTPGGTDGVVNADEAAQGLTLTGVVEPGSSLVVTLGAVSHVATVDASGNWSATFAPAELPSGEVDVTLTLDATDAAGNTRSESQTVQFDTVAGTLTLSPNPIEGDDVINAVEASDGVVIHGTSDPGAVVTVTLEGVTHTALTDATGNWTTTYSNAQIAPGTYVADITAQITDPAGNTLMVSDTVNVDTQVDNFANLKVSTGADDVINFDEAAQGVSVTGTTEPGATVMVTIEGVARPATVDAAGNWTAVFEGGSIQPGEYDTVAHVESIDAAGNVAQLSEPVRVDTFVNQLDMTGSSAGTDDVLSGAELRSGGALALSGQVEPGSTVAVRFNGQDYTATVGAAGAWSVAIPEADVPPGEYDAQLVISATDAAGNTTGTTETLHVDTVAPDGPIVESITQDTSGLRGISTQLTEDPQDIFAVSESGTISDVPMSSVAIGAIGETNFHFTPTVPDGSDLIVSTSDAAGNSRATYLVLDDEETGTQVTLDNAGLGAHNIEAVDLEFAEEAHLTLTEADILALSDASDTLTVYGDSDDQVTITGATYVGPVTNGAGQGFVEYQLGDATVLIDDDITNVVI